MYKLPPLPFDYADLEPYLDKETMEVHYTKHHQAYADKLNAALEKHPELWEKDLRELIYDADALPEDIRSMVVNNGGGYLNHIFYWQILGKPEAGKDDLREMEVGKRIMQSFDGIEEFKAAFREKAMSVFGSGWTWLAVQGGRLEIINTSNQNLLPKDCTPILVLDLWEHAYYLKFQNRRAEFIDAFWNVVKWQKVNDLFIAAK